MATPTVAVSNSCPADLHAVKRELSGECGADCRLAHSVVMSLLLECVFFNICAVNLCFCSLMSQHHDFLSAHTHTHTRSAASGVFPRHQFPLPVLST